MTEQQHPIAPSFELINQWYREACRDPYHGGQFYESKTLKHIATRAAQWGADYELEACCQEMKSLPRLAGVSFGEMASNALLAARRPKPPSLKEQALLALSHLVKGADESMDTMEAAEYVRRALESIND